MRRITLVELHFHLTSHHSCLGHFPHWPSIFRSFLFRDAGCHVTNSRSLRRNASFSTNALPFVFCFTIAGNCGRIDLFCFLDYLSLPLISPVTLRSNDTDLILPLIVESFGAWDVGAVKIMIPIAQCWKRKSRPLYRKHFPYIIMIFVKDTTLLQKTCNVMLPILKFFNKQIHFLPISE